MRNCFILRAILPVFVGNIADIVDPRNAIIVDFPVNVN